MKRPLFIVAAAVAAALCVYRGRGVFALLAALIIGIGLPLAHASLRSPNLKARLASAREEFRAVWCVCVWVFVFTVVWAAAGTPRASEGHDENKTFVLTNTPHPHHHVAIRHRRGYQAESHDYTL